VFCMCASKILRLHSASEEKPPDVRRPELALAFGRAVVWYLVAFIH
jgi:hypothetical protein